MKTVLKGTLYCGRNKPDGGFVSSKEFDNWLLDVANIFEGFTVSEAEGFYKGSRELTKVITFIQTVETDQEFKKGLILVAGLYRTTFKQECVLVEVCRVSCCFESGDCLDAETL